MYENDSTIQIFEILSVSSIFVRGKYKHILNII